MARRDIDLSLAAQLTKLFETTRDDRGKIKSAEAVANEITARGVPISGVYLHALKTGIKDNPTKRHLQGLSDYFGVDPSYFFDQHGDDAQRIDEELTVMLAMRDAKVRALTMRASGLSETALNSLLGVVDYSREAEGLPPIDPDGKRKSKVRRARRK